MDINDYIIAFRSRGAPNEIEEMNASNLVRVTRDFAIFTSGGMLKLIPLHRILYVRNIKTGERLYPFKRELRT